jgi:hypothetical protein
MAGHASSDGVDSQAHVDAAFCEHIAQEVPRTVEKWSCVCRQNDCADCVKGPDAARSNSLHVGQTKRPTQEVSLWEVGMVGA